jgi:hypothetical protein
MLRSWSPWFPTTNHDVAFLGRASPTLHSAGSIDEDEDSDDEGSDLHPFAHSSIIHADTTTMASASQYLLQSGSLIKQGAEAVRLSRRPVKISY